MSAECRGQSVEVTGLREGFEEKVEGAGARMEK